MKVINSSSSNGEHQNGNESHIETPYDVGNSNEDLDNTPWAQRIRIKSNTKKGKNETIKKEEEITETRIGKKRSGEKIAMVVEKKKKKTRVSESSEEEYTPKVYIKFIFLIHSTHK
jgi:hypothetical protein